MSAVEHLATHQSEYHADPDIYGSFADRGDEIARTFKAHGLLTRFGSIAATAHAAPLVAQTACCQGIQVWFASTLNAGVLNDKPSCPMGKPHE